MAQSATPLFRFFGPPRCRWRPASTSVGSRRASRLTLAYAADAQLRSTTNPSLQLPAF